MERKEWVSRHAPVLNGPVPHSPLTVGNGRFAFTADVTGLQTLYGEYAAVTPLCTMADWGWHTVPNAEGGAYTLDDVVMDEYDFCGRTVRYAKSKFPGNEAVYDWLRENPHKANLARIGLRLKGREIRAEELSGVHQRLDLYAGVLESRFTLGGVGCEVRTMCDPETDALYIDVTSPLLTQGLTVDVDFPYGAPDITASDWQKPERHETVLKEDNLLRRMDDLTYAVRLCAPGAGVTQPDAHRIRITACSDSLTLTASFGREKAEPAQHDGFEARVCAWWRGFWEDGAMLDLSGSSDPRASELERRIVQSLYLLAVNSAGSMPPAETGLTCNSWYGKAHLEMHLWHMAWAPLWGRRALLERSLPWYLAHLPQARENAARNGYHGARWPKMIGPEGIDCPSPIATLLIWQQPHILTMLELIRRARTAEGADTADFMREYWPLVRETADFMADYAVLDPADGLYHIEPPVIPVQERYDPQTVRDPSYEIAYWRFGISLAIGWAERISPDAAQKWRPVRDRMAPPPMHDGLYTAHAACPETFSRYTDDHPSMLMCLGVLPGEGIDDAAMARTLDRVEAVWQDEELWGWDFAVMAMTAARMGQPERALSLLLSDKPKNAYVESGHNRQAERRDLPLYLPGNGSLLLAAALLTQRGVFDAQDSWHARAEGLLAYL